MDEQKLINKNVPFFHAMNLRGYWLYCQHGAVLSREKILERDLGATAFRSDEKDRKKGALCRIFGNVYDFAAIYARASSDSTPNIYGPVTLRFPAKLYGEVKDLVITKCSIVRYDDWRSKCLSEEELGEMLLGDNFGPISKNYWYSEASFAAQELPLAKAEEALVDAIEFEGVCFSKIVQNIHEEMSVELPVKRREIKNANRQKFYQDITNHFSSVLSTDKDAKFIDMVKSERQQDRWIQWAEYFMKDTVNFLKTDGSKYVTIT